MSTQLPTPPPVRSSALPTHLDLPDTDGLPVINSAEPLQSRLLTESLRPVPGKLHPDGQYFIGQDCGIYWRQTDPPLAGCKAPDWFYVPGVPPAPPDSPFRRSYVLWQEHVPPAVVIEYVSDDGGTEWDQTPNEGKFWVYDQVFRVSYYAIHTHRTGELEVYHRVGGRLKPMPANADGRYSIELLGVALGTYRERREGLDLDWVRWFEPGGALLLADEEQWARERLERERAERRARDAEHQATIAQAQARRFADKLRELGIDPNQL